MKTNHRRAPPKSKGSRHPVRRLTQAVKADASQSRRVMERQTLDRLRLGDLEPDEATFPTRNHEVADRWSHD